MAYLTQVFQVLIASPSDCHEYRQAAVDALAQWNRMNSKEKQVILSPLMWEFAAPMITGEDAQAVLNQELDAADSIVVLCKFRLGTATPRDISGTIEELNRAIRAGKPAFFYRYDGPIQSISELDSNQLMALETAIRQKQGQGLIQKFRDSGDLKSQLLEHLSRMVDVIQHRVSMVRNQPTRAETQAEQSTPSTVNSTTHAQSKTGLLCDDPLGNPTFVEMPTKLDHCFIEDALAAMWILLSIPLWRREMQPNDLEAAWTDSGVYLSKALLFAPSDAPFFADAQVAVNLTEELSQSGKLDFQNIERARSAVERALALMMPESQNLFDWWGQLVSIHRNCDLRLASLATARRNEPTEQFYQRTRDFMQVLGMLWIQYAAVKGVDFHSGFGEVIPSAIASLGEVDGYNSQALTEWSKKLRRELRGVMYPELPLATSNASRELSPN